MTDHPDPMDTLARALWLEAEGPAVEYPADVVCLSPDAYARHDRLHQEQLAKARALRDQIAPALVAEAVAKEREACHRVAALKGEQMAGSSSSEVTDAICAAIRARTP